MNSVYKKGKGIGETNMRETGSNSLEKKQNGSS